jgi:outer membrane protein OmpA-like peptidoglycan-associated protein
MLDDHDEGARIGVWVALGVVGFLLFGLIFGLAWRSLKPAVKPAAAIAAPAALAKVYFEVGKAELPANVAQPLADSLAAVTADRDKKLVLSGFHDPTGDPALNAELAKNRAKAVREALKARGVAADRILLRKPEQTSADGPAAEARRVEIRSVNMP